MKLKEVPRLLKREAGTSDDALDVDDLLDAGLSEPASGRFWATALVGGAFCTLLVFVFLGSLQPTMNSSEAIKLPDLVQLQTGLGSNRKPPPPPEERQQKEEPKRKPRPKRVKQTVRKTIVKRTIDRPQTFRANLSPGLGLGLNLNMSIGGAAAVAIAIPEATSAFAQEARDVAEYVERREQVRQRTHDLRGRALDDAFGAGLSKPQEIFRPKPPYPPEARRKEIEGFVIVNVLISADGTIDEYEILGADPEGIFEDTVISNLPRWRFSPAKDSSGRPIEFWKDYKIEFRLEE